MRTFQAQTANLSLRAENSTTVLACAFTRVMSRFAAILNRCGRTDDDIVARYAGCSWNDATERQMIGDITTMRYTSL
jgi:hypothetical protein